MASKNWHEAAIALEKLASLAPDFPEVQGNLGLAYYGQNRVFDAAQAFERALKLNPRMNQARVMLGLCDAELGHNEEAIQLLAPAIAQVSNEPMARVIGLGLLRAYSAVGEESKGVQVATDLLKRFPKDPEILFHAARFYADRSYGLMKDLIDLPTDSSWVHYASGEVYESTGRYDTALAEYRTVVKIAPRLPGVHFRIGRILLQKSQDALSLTEAEREFEQELMVAPQHAEAEYELGEIYRHRSQFDQAIERFSRAVRYQPQFPEARIGLARSLISVGKNREALEHLEAAARLDPLNDIPHYLLVSAYRSLGDPAKSGIEMTKFQNLRATRRERAWGNARPPAVTEVTPQTLDSEAVRRP